MQPVEIKKDIYWVGCVDYDHRDFHGYSRSPDGSTYHAYLITDQKNVLLDTVAPGCAGTRRCRLAKTLPPEKVDYIGCNSLFRDEISGEIAGNMATAPVEVRLRISGRAKDRKQAELLANEVEALYTNGPAGGGGAVKRVESVVSVCSIFVPRDAVHWHVEYSEVQ